MLSMNISELYPQRELDFGIIMMKADDYPGLNIITKPGSYKWPDYVEFRNKPANTG